MMKSLFRGAQMRSRESLIRKRLSTELMTCVKIVQFDVTRDVKCDAESEGSLLNILEAMFMHGLKENLMDKMSSLLGDPDQRPSPEFWSLLMIFSHSEIIRQISQLSQITNDVGRSRAWLRLTLNEGLLVSYLSMICQDNSALFPYYKRYAFLRDLESLGVAIEVLNGLSRVAFSLPVNSSLLNTWPNAPLLLAGLWTPPMKDAPVGEGVDIVRGIVDAVEVEEENVSVASFPSSSGRLYEEEALKIILGTPLEGSPVQSHMFADDDSESKNSRADPAEKMSEEGTGSAFVTFPSTQENAEALYGINDSNEESQALEKVDEEINSTLESYHTVIDTYHVKDKEVKAVNLEDIIEKFGTRKDRTTPPKEETSPKSPSMNKSLILEDYEVITDSSIPLVHSVSEFKFFIKQLGKLMHERGLIEQNFACKECSTLIGFSFAKAWVCYLTGCYYCKDCYKPVECPLPAKILHNWDFALYPVHEKAANFLKDIQEFPLFDVRRTNPQLYLFFPEMLSLQKLRLQLNYIRSYLFTCQDQTKEKVKQLLWPKEYLYEHVHLYAVVDLIDIPNGKLEDLLKRAIKISTSHILSCQLCSQKGYICEVCKDNKVIYPFYIDDTYRCPSCRTVYHLNCRKETCPKCDRIKKRKATMKS